jgi:hypothetical protein
MNSKYLHGIQCLYPKLAICNHCGGRATHAGVFVAPPEFMDTLRRSRENEAGGIPAEGGIIRYGACDFVMPGQIEDEDSFLVSGDIPLNDLQGVDILPLPYPQFAADFNECGALQTQFLPAIIFGANPMWEIYTLPDQMVGVAYCDTLNLYVNFIALLEETSVLPLFCVKRLDGDKDIYRKLEMLWSEQIKERFSPFTLLNGLEFPSTVAALAELVTEAGCELYARPVILVNETAAKAIPLPECKVMAVLGGEHAHPLRLTDVGSLAIYPIEAGDGFSERAGYFHSVAHFATDISLDVVDIIEGALLVQRYTLPPHPVEVDCGDFICRIAFHRPSQFDKQVTRIQLQFKSKPVRQFQSVGEIPYVVDFYINFQSKRFVSLTGTLTALDKTESHAKFFAAIGACILRDFWVSEMQHYTRTIKHEGKRIRRKKSDKPKRKRGKKTVIYLPRKTLSFRTDTRTVESRLQHSPISPHTVRGHLRQLPEKWQASKDAVEAAMAYGLRLGEGYTFVKPHARGTDSEITETLTTYRSKSALQVLFAGGVTQ